MFDPKNLKKSSEKFYPSDFNGMYVTFPNNYYLIWYEKEPKDRNYMDIIKFRKNDNSKTNKIDEHFAKC